MPTSGHTNLVCGFAAGAGLAASAALLMGQAANQPVRSETQYFVSAEGHLAHLWVREGASLRCVGHGECAHEGHEHGEEGHQEGGAHDHDKEKPEN